MGSAVLWQFAAWMGQPFTGGPAEAEAATGCPRVGVDTEEPPNVSATPEPAHAAAPTPAPANPTAQQASPQSEPPATPVSPTAAPAIAIVGIGCHFPKSRGAEQFWDNILNEVSAIQPVTEGRWDPDLYLDEDRGVLIGPTPPSVASSTTSPSTPVASASTRVADQVDPVQQMTLQCMADALDDANLKSTKSDGRPFDRERCAVILGGNGGEIKDAYAIDSTGPWSKSVSRSASFPGLNPQGRVTRR